MADYKAGVYAELGDSIRATVDTSTGKTVYFGTAPKGKTNTIIEILDAKDAIDKIGYNGTRDFSLFDAVRVHDLTQIFPIYVVNVLDPEAHKGEAGKEIVSFIKGKAILENSMINPDTIELEDRTEGKDYTLTIDGTSIVLELLKGKPAGGTQQVAFRESQKANLEKAGLTTDGFTIKYVETGTIPKALVHDDKAYACIQFPKPEGAVSVVVYRDGEILNPGADLVNGNEEKDSVIDGEYSCYFAFANADGTRLPMNDLNLTFIWTMSDGTTRETATNVKRLPKNEVDQNGFLEVSFETVDPSKVTADDIIGGVDEKGRKSGLAVIRNLERQFGIAENIIIAAPGYSHIPEVFEAMTSMEPINGHWRAYVIADLPEASTIDEAIKVKEAYSAENASVCWPAVVTIDHVATPLSVVVAAAQMAEDFANGDIPSSSCSNRDSIIEDQHFPDEEVEGFDQDEANALRANGITTAVYYNGGWRVWGPHTSAFSYRDGNDPRADYTTQIRMLLFLINGFQRRYARYIDRPMTNAVKNEILIAEQQYLDSLKAQEHLQGTPRITFSVKNNRSTILEGEFIYEGIVTPTKPLRKITATFSFDENGYLEGN